MSETKFFTAFAGVLESVDSASQKAVFELMTEGANKNRQGLSKQEIQRLLPTLKGKALCIGANYRTGHNQPLKMKVGTWEKTEQKDDYALGTVLLSDSKVVDLLKTGEIGPVSWNIAYNNASCSKCHTFLDGNYLAHACIQQGDAYAQLHGCSFCENAFDFVPAPAYPTADFQHFTCAGINQHHYSSDKAQKLAAYAGMYELSQTIQQQQYQIKNEEDVKDMSEKPTINKDFSNDIAKLSGDLKTLTDTVSGLVKAVEPIQKIAGEFENQSKKAHASLVEKAYKYRASAGVAVEETIERAKLAKDSTEVLEEKIADAKKVIAKNPKPEENNVNPANSTGTSTRKADENNNNVEEEEDEGEGEAFPSNKAQAGVNSKLTMLEAINSTRKTLGLTTGMESKK